MDKVKPFAKSGILAVAIIAMSVALAYAARNRLRGGHELDLAESLKDYRGWVRVNDSPYRISPATSALCAAPGAGKVDPHAGAYINVYANGIAATVMLKHSDAVFPVGSVIVKEKLGNQDSSEPDLLTVMIKREAGYNPTAGDWEFAVLDGKAISVQAEGRLANCAECHMTRSKSDYVFGGYMTSR